MDGPIHRSGVAFRRGVHGIRFKQVPAFVGRVAVGKKQVQVGVGAFAAAGIGLNVDEAQVLFGQIFPFVVEIVPFDAAPQVMTIRARALDTGIKFL